MIDQILYLLLLFLYRFLGILFNLTFWALIIWVVLSWLMVFRIMRPDNPGFILFSQIVRPILIPFRWARLGMLDLSVIVAILFIDFVGSHLLKVIAELLSNF